MLNNFRFQAGQFAVTLSEFVFSGTDVESFFQTQSTFDTDLLKSDGFHLASFLDPQGRVECYGWLVKQNGTFFYLVPSVLSDRALARLTKFLISEDVEIRGPVEIAYYFNFGGQGSGVPGNLFDEPATLLKTPLPGVPLIPSEDIELWRGLTGWPSFDGSDYSCELLNNLRLFDLSLIPNKGCYPGQETVSKIATRRGVAYAPVLIELQESAVAGEIHSFDKKIGAAQACYFWEGKYYLAAHLLRDFRVELMKIHFTLNGREMDGIVRYYPLLKGDKVLKALELYYAATEAFQQDRLAEAEQKFRNAIDLNPAFADAYESLGVMLGRQERFEEAISLMRMLAEIDPSSVLAHTNMSLYLMRQGKIEEAEEQKSLATVKSFQSFGNEAKRKEAETNLKQQKQKEWEQRESMFRQVLDIDPDDTLANYGLGSIAVEREDWSRAQEHLERVLKQDAKYSVAYLALGKALKGLGQKDAAIKVWKEGIKIAASKGDLMPANQMQQEVSLYE